MAAQSVYPISRCSAEQDKQTEKRPAPGEHAVAKQKKTWRKIPHNRLRSQNSSKEHKFDKKNSQMKLQNLVKLKWQGREDTA